MTSLIAQTELGIMPTLNPGDRVEARNSGGEKWVGTVDVAAPLLGIVWLWTEMGERKAFDVHDYEIEHAK
jgi:hypothetical protein